MAIFRLSNSSTCEKHITLTMARAVYRYYACVAPASRQVAHLCFLLQLHLCIRRIVCVVDHSFNNAGYQPALVYNTCNTAYCCIAPGTMQCATQAAMPRSTTAGYITCFSSCSISLPAVYGRLECCACRKASNAANEQLLRLSALVTPAFCAAITPYRTSS